MSDFVFVDATKEQAKARLALIGPSGSGKTYTALVTARAFGGPAALIDTEHGSASKYADLFQFKTLRMNAFDPRMLIRALAAAGQQGFETVVVDSLSHFWMGSEGMLEQVDKAARRSYGGNSFGGWKEMRPVERDMIEALVAYPGHVIVTMRVKTEYVIEVNDRGKSVPKKVGLKPEQRDGLEYEMDLVADLDLENTMVVSKSRCPALAGQVIRKPDEGFGKTLLEWLGAGKPAPDANAYRDRAIEKGATYESLRALYDEVERRGLTGAAVMDDTGETTSLGAFIIARGKQAPKETPGGAS